MTSRGSWKRWIRGHLIIMPSLGWDHWNLTFKKSGFRMFPDFEWSDFRSPLYMLSIFRLPLSRAEYVDVPYDGWVKWPLWWLSEMTFSAFCRSNMSRVIKRYTRPSGSRTNLRYAFLKTSGWRWNDSCLFVMKSSKMSEVTRRSCWLICVSSGRNDEFSISTMLLLKSVER